MNQKINRVISCLLAAAAPFTSLHAEDKSKEKPKQPVAIVWEQEEKLVPEITLTSDCATRYVLRGFHLIDLGAGPVLQETAAITYNGFALAGLTNVDLEKGKATEADLFTSYTITVGSVKGSAGYNLYTFPNTELPKTQEVFLGGSIETALATPSLKVFYDFDEGKGIYGELGVEKSVDIGAVKVAVSATLGYNCHYFRADSGISHGEVKAGISISIGENVTVTPYFRFSEAIDKKDFKDETTGGLTIDVKF